MSQEVVTVDRSGLIERVGDDRIEAYLPSECPQNHAANIYPMPDGDLLCVWFGGTQEGIADISIFMRNNFV